MSEALERRLAARRRAELVSSLRQLARPASEPPGERRPTRGNGPAGESCDLCGNEIPPDHRHVLQLDRTAHPVRVRELPGASLGRPGASPERHAGRLARRLRALRRALGSLRRSRSAWPSFCATAPRAASSPSIRARPGRPSPSSTWTRGRSSEPPTQRSMTLEADAEALIVNRMARAAEARDRADRRVLPAGRPDQGELGGDLGRRRAARRRSSASSASCGRGAQPVSGLEGKGRDTPAADERDEERPTGRRPSSRWWAWSRSSARPPPRFVRVRATDPRGRRVYMIALIDLITSSPSKRTYDAETRERLVELFGEPERWATTTTNFRWTQTDVFVPTSPEQRSSTIPVACTYDLEVAASKYFHGLADGDAPLRFHFNGTVFYEGADGAMQLCRSRGTARCAIRCRSRPGRR